MLVAQPFVRPLCRRAATGLSNREPFVRSNGGMIGLLFRLWALRKVWTIIRDTRRRSNFNASGR
jgi:hypothetical protein